MPVALDASGRAWLFMDEGDGRHVMRWESGTLADLGALPGFAANMPAEGLIAGGVPVDGCLSPCDQSRALFLWRETGVTELPLAMPTSDAQVRDISSGGTVLVNVGDLASIWDGVTQTDLGAGTGAAINDAGQAVGTAFGAGSTRAFLWSSGTRRDLALLPGGTSSQAMDINAAGDVVGSVTDASGRSRAVIWRSGSDPVEIPAGAEDSTWALMINDAGHVLVASTAGRRWLWDGTHAQAIGTIGQRISITGLNERGEVFGSYHPGGGSDARAFVWRDGTLHDLGTGTTGGVSASVQAGNDNGDLLGFYLTTAGNIRPVLWRRLGL